MNSFFETLKGVEKVMYKSAYNFHMKYTLNANEESAHQAGLREIDRINKLRNQPEETWIDITTGKTHKANH